MTRLSFASNLQKVEPAGASGRRSAGIGMLVVVDVVLVVVDVVLVEVDVVEEVEVLVDVVEVEVVEEVLVLVGGGALVCVMATLLYVHGSGEHVGPVTVPAAHARACPSEPVKDRSVLQAPTSAVSEPLNCPFTDGVNTPVNWPLIPPVICLLAETHDPLTP
jgi:hypothetical protein